MESDTNTPFGIFVHVHDNRKNYLSSHQALMNKFFKWRTESISLLEKEPKMQKR